VAGRRKLFITHAGELANRLVHTVERNGMVAKFARSYAERHGRAGLLSEAARLPELESTIGREALLIMSAEVRRLLPRAFVAASRGALDSGDAAFVEGFYAEFLASLGRALEWRPAEARAEAGAFRRDLEMYSQWCERSPNATGAAGADESPFRDRCALLLDPPMMEQARRAAADFEKEIIRAAAQIFGQLGRSRLPLRQSARHRAKAPRRKSKKKSQKRTRRSTRSGKRKPKVSRKRLRRR
jgi:hypothetical protein